MAPKCVNTERLKHILNASSYYGTKAQRDFCDMIAECDAADVRENIHGRWIVDEDGNIECSVCGHHGVGDLYCERCGAVMDGSEEPTMDAYMYGQEGNEEDGSL